MPFDARSGSPADLPPRRRARCNPFFGAMRLAFRIVVGIIIIVDELVRPLYEPLVRWVEALALVQRFERWVAGLPPYAILALIGVPYAVVEPVKFLALVHMANGHVRTGTIVLVLAYLVSFVLIERVYTAGRAQLMQVPWVAWVIVTSGLVRDRLYAWLRLPELKARARVVWRWVRLRLR
ncbi:hypothetical protein V5F38_06825 [Xanthobacter sp. V0B-10]|uniref:hypothetical protein n=1 Tax=Xanthobacter albus TaxID=3119929 RepID=UPI003726E5CE